MSDEHLDELIDLYALGALEPNEQVTADVHLETCAHCREQLVEAKRLVALLAWTPEQHDPPAELHDRLMRRIEQRHTLRPRKQPSWWQRLNAWQAPFPRLAPRMAAAFALVLVSVLGVRTVQLQQSLNAERAARTNLEQRLSAVQTQLAEQQPAVAVLRSPQARLVSLQTQAAAPAGFLLLSPDSQTAVVNAAALPALPADQTYQLWLIAGAQPESVGTFRTDAQGTATIDVQAQQPLGQYQAFGISVEPAGGSAQPTTTPIVLTNL